jgi:hypothetical protein
MLRPSGATNITPNPGLPMLRPTASCGARLRGYQHFAMPEATNVSPRRGYFESLRNGRTPANGGGSGVPPFRREIFESIPACIFIKNSCNSRICTIFVMK